MPTIRDLLQSLDATCPLSRAESWDKVGLQIGDIDAQVARALVAHEVTEATIEEAAGCQALVVYHPLIFQPLKSLDFRDHTARLAGLCIARGLSVIVLHTALDNAVPPGALGDHLAAELGLAEVAVLKPSGHEPLCKIVVFVPPEAMEAVSEAMWEAGAGHIGNYDRAGFRARGTGTFRPLPGANPYSGQLGELEQADEWRLEVIVQQRHRDTVVRAMIAAHPYEEVAYDLYALQNKTEPYGSARVGLLPAPTDGAAFAAQVSEKLRAPGLRAVLAKSPVHKVACVPGSGASYIEAAAAAGCDCLVTGDIKHHDALKALALGLNLVDATHSATERAAVGLIAPALQSLSGVEVVVSNVDTNPFAKLAN